MTIDSTPILALVSPEIRPLFELPLTPFHVDLTFVRRLTDLFALTREGRVFSVMILPASLPDAELWALWGELALLTPRPEFVIYARTASFGLWSGVLEVGGHDVLVEPFRAEEVQKTVLGARRAFEKRQTTAREDY